MKLRSKLLLAQLPLGAALAAVGALGVGGAADLGERAGLILRENYRSVLAAQRMGDALERLDAAALASLAGQPGRAAIALGEERRIFDEELATEAQLLTEPGEPAAVEVLISLWTTYRADYAGFTKALEAERRTLYFTRLESAFVATRRAVARILEINQDAMVRKSDEALVGAGRIRDSLLLIAGLALLLGAFSSIWLTARLVRPLEGLGGAVRRVAEGDLEARANPVGNDELAVLARDFNDMTEKLHLYRKSSLGELLQAQEAARAAIDSLPDPVVVFDARGEVVSYNEAAEALFEADARGLGAQPLGAAPPALRAAILRVRDHVLRGLGAYQPKEFGEALRVQTAEGERSFLPRGSPMHDADGALGGVTILLQDVTRLRRFADLENDLVATVAHELRTPLTSLRMAVHLCVEEAVGPLNERQSDLLHAGREECERLQRIVDDLLDLARLRDGKLAIAPSPVAAGELMADARSALQHVAEQAKVALSIEEEPALPAVLADRERIGLVFANLVGNALRHSAEGGEVALSARGIEGGVRFEVRDRGPGIPPEEHQRIFTRFARLQGSPEGGAGLGLSIAKEIVVGHGGQIGVDSVVGEGSTFWFTLPAAG